MGSRIEVERVAKRVRQRAPGKGVVRLPRSVLPSLILAGGHRVSAIRSYGERGEPDNPTPRSRSLHQSQLGSRGGGRYDLVVEAPGPDWGPEAANETAHKRSRGCVIAIVSAVGR